MTDAQTVAGWRGAEVVDREGDKIGKLEEIYLDEDTDKPEWALVKTGLFGGRGTFVPLTGAQPEGDAVRVAFEKEQVKGAPSIEPDGELSQEQEAELYRFYGLEYGEDRSDSGLPEGGREPVGEDVSGPETDDAMTRSEEELRVGKARTEAGRVRLKKYVVTDQVTETVPVQREQVRVEREPITDANAGAALDGPAISEEEHEVTLHEEQAVVEKRAVPKERVRLDKETVTEEQTVTDEVRKERIEVDGDQR